MDYVGQTTQRMRKLHFRSQGRDQEWSWWTRETFPWQPWSRSKFERWKNIWGRNHETFQVNNNSKCSTKHALDSVSTWQTWEQVQEAAYGDGLSRGNKFKGWEQEKKKCWKLTAVCSSFKNNYIVSLFNFFLVCNVYLYLSLILVILSLMKATKCCWKLTIKFLIIFCPSAVFTPIT